MYCRWVAAGQLVRSTYITVCTADMNILNRINPVRLKIFMSDFQKTQKIMSKEGGRKKKTLFTFTKYQVPIAREQHRLGDRVGNPSFCI